jgi:16S rRNA (cytosine1402-N4)-methyltransferase
MHIPVLVAEVLSQLALQSGDQVIDGTAGFGGHAVALAEQVGESGRYLGIEKDPHAVAAAAERVARFGDRAMIVHGDYANMAAIARAHGMDHVRGVLLDLGFSSWQVDASGRGFSFLRDEPLDMRFDPTIGPSAAELLSGATATEIAQWLWEYGDEQRSRQLAREIVAVRKQRPLRTTFDLISLVESVKGKKRERGLHPATKVFQALRIAVNDEFGHVRVGLEQALETLALDGRMAVISFHSGEDRIVKQFFREKARGCTCPPELPVCACGKQPALRILTKKPITASPEEEQENSRARSAKLRIAQKI